LSHSTFPQPFHLRSNHPFLLPTLTSFYSSNLSTYCMSL
jgi:hypothetical protein